MYEWLQEALAGHSVVITANRRLARVLSSVYADQQQAAGRTAWRSPEIHAWPDWLRHTLDQVERQQELPTQINTRQSQWLWERCLRKELPDKDAGFSNLVRLARDARQRLLDWQISSQELVAHCETLDQRLFAAATRRYEGVLRQKNWIDDAGLAPLLLRLITAKDMQVAARISLVGFDRIRPITKAVVDALRTHGASPQWIESGKTQATAHVQEFAVPAKEYRSAGAWARQQIEARPSDSIGIVTTGLQSNGDEIERWVREGATPGWQTGPADLLDTVNVSYGRNLTAYPSIAIALLCLQWDIEDVSSSDLSLLLRSNSVGAADLSARARLETQLRQTPDRLWSPSAFGAVFRQEGDAASGDAWFKILEKLSARRRARPPLAMPSQWATFFDETLDVWQWPGRSTLDSVEFQLLNKWREMLNELARLDLVAARVPASTALSQLRSLCGDAIFQAESTNPRIHLLGPLEAAGLEFDQLWVCGLTAENWPPASRPSALISRRLQEQYAMPDATPADTSDYAKRILARLSTAADTVRFSYARSVDDAEQAMTGLVTAFADFKVLPSDEEFTDPGWYASALRDISTKVCVDDSVPSVSDNETILGGAATLQRQIDEPLSAFVHGRLGARSLYPQAVGLTPPLRGNLIHDALYKLYLEQPDRAALDAWSKSDIDTRVDAALDFAFGRHVKSSTAVLRRLFAIERQRIARLVKQFVAVDISRTNFQVASVEGKLEYRHRNLQLPLRFDRIDIVDDESLTILDYKTGSPKQLLSRDEQINDIQLFVYALATQKNVSALALVNIDSRDIAFSGAGRGFRGESRWPELQDEAKRIIEEACEELIAGDVRINLRQGTQSARGLNLLSRYTELLRDAR